jgi:hypothetical protein
MLLETKLLQTAASLRTFFWWVICPEALKSLVAFLGYSQARDARISTKTFRSIRVFRGQCVPTVVDSRLHVVVAPLLSHSSDFCNAYNPATCPKFEQGRGLTGFEKPNQRTPRMRKVPIYRSLTKSGYSAIPFAHLSRRNRRWVETTRPFRFRSGRKWKRCHPDQDTHYTRNSNGLLVRAVNLDMADWWAPPSLHR